jgi:hypothetical protein
MFDFGIDLFRKSECGLRNVLNVDAFSIIKSEMEQFKLPDTREHTLNALR